MKLLLDTHVLIWLVEGNDSLTQAAQEAIENEDYNLYLSIASLWEITIKMSLGKLRLDVSLDRILESYLLPSGIKILPINLSHLLVLRDLPLHHRDPFDRLLISQARAEKLTLLSGDGLFGDYLVPILW